MTINIVRIIKSTAAKINEARESEFNANKHMQTSKVKAYRPALKPSGQDYFSYNASKTKMNVKEDAPAMSAGGAGDPGLVQNPTVNYAAQKIKKILTRRAKQKE